MADDANPMDDGVQDRRIALYEEFLDARRPPASYVTWLEAALMEARAQIAALEAEPSKAERVFCKAASIADPAEAVRCIEEHLRK